MMEMEDCRLRDDRTREESKRREEREFQLKMMMIMKMMIKQQEGKNSLLSFYNSGYDYSTHASSSSQQWPESDF